MSVVHWWVKILQDRDDLQQKIDDSSNDYKELGQLSKQMHRLAPLVNCAEKARILHEDNRYLQELKGEDGAEEIIHDNNAELERLYEEVVELKAGKASDISKLIVEMRPGAGGEESSLFVTNLLQLYQEYACEAGWSFEILSIEHADGGQGIKNASAYIEGPGAYNRLQFEAGVHRVQRIPVTEANGRIHTSTATVAILPEPEDVDIEIDPRYLRIDVYRAGGAGGQHVNKTESAVRLTYSHPDLLKPEEVAIQDEKSQHKNKAKAMKILKARIGHAMQERVDQERAAQRRVQVGRALRSEKIRTYNFQQNRVTDHRCKISVYNLQSDSLLLPQDLNKIIDALHLMGKEAVLNWIE